MIATRTPTLPIRRLDDLEIPTTGTWPVTRTSSVAKSTGRRNDLRQVHVLAGRFEVGDDPIDSSLRIDLEDSTLIATAAWVSPDRHGMSEWRFEGIAEHADGHDPLGLTLGYHGVFRRGIDVWAWFSGTGTIATPTGRRGLRRSKVGGEQIVVDLLFTAPDVTRIPQIPPIAPNTPARHNDSRVMQLPRLGAQPFVFGLDSRASRHSPA